MQIEVGTKAKVHHMGDINSSQTAIKATKVDFETITSIT